MMEWKEVRLGDVCSAQNGFAFKSEQFIKNGNCKIIKIKELKDGSIVFTDDSAEVEDDAKFKKYEVFQNDILFALTGDPVSRPNPFSWVGRVARYNHTKKALINQRVCKMLFTDKIDSNFFYYYFRQQSVLAELAGKARGSASQANISTNEILNTIISLPSLFYQRRIASILSSLDKKIETNNKINANLEEMAQAIFKNWFVDFAPFKDGKFVESELGMIPEGWRVGTLSEVASFISRGISPKYDTTTDEWVLGQTCVRNNIVTLNNARTHLPKKKNEKWVKQWDVLINSTGMGSLGRVGIVYFDKDNVALDSHLTVVRVDNQQLRHYIGRNLLSRQGEIENMAVGSTGQTELPRDSVKGMKIIIPNADDIEPFNKTIEAIALKIYSHLMQNQQLATLRDTLLPRLMSGEIEV